jgi:trimethylamine--corrinoid protein Co-methyltransferase
MFIQLGLQQDGLVESPVGTRRGRKARVAERTKAEGGSNSPNTLRRRVPTYELLEPAELDRLETHSDWILEEIGVEFRGDPEALELFAGAGALITGERVRFPAGLAKELCASAPSEFDMCGRDGRNVSIGGDHVVFLPAYGSPFVSDQSKLMK